MTTDRAHLLMFAVVQAIGFIVAALTGERWAIVPAAATVVVVASVLLRLRVEPVEAHPMRREQVYRQAAEREEDTLPATPRHAPKRVLYAEYQQANDASFGLCAGAAVLGAVGLGLAAYAWCARAGWPLPLSGGFTTAGFALLAWWSRCRSTVQAWRERERGER